jgi:hypothetical protein
VSLLVLDESGHFQTDSEGVGAGKEVYQALSPSVAQFGDRGYVMFTSTPKWRSGLFWEQWRNGTEGIDPQLLVIKRATWEMNPTITRESLEPEFRVDPDGAATEYGADFSAAEGAFLDPKDILACQRETGTLAPDQDIRYKAAIGSGRGTELATSEPWTRWPLSPSATGSAPCAPTNTPPSRSWRACRSERSTVRPSPGTTPTSSRLSPA